MLPFHGEARVGAVLGREELMSAVEAAQVVAFSAGHVAKAVRQMLPVEPHDRLQALL